MYKFDAFSKPMQEFTTKTKVGGYISILTCVTIAYLLLAEIWYFLETEQRDEMIVDLDQDKQEFSFNLEMTLPDLPCSVLAVNAVHMKNTDNMMHVAHTITKQRVMPGASQSGVEMPKPSSFIGQSTRVGLSRIALSAGEFADQLAKNLKHGDPDFWANLSDAEKLEHANRKDRCGSCYGAHVDEDDCCNSCDDVKNAFAKKGWSLPSSYTIEQCDNTVYEQHPPQANEGCLLKAHLQSKKVPAIIQLGIAYDFNARHLHAERVEKIKAGYISFTHKMHKINFGPDFPGFIPVLDGMQQQHEHVPLIESWNDSKMESQSEHWQYDLHLIPTEYVSPLGTKTESHQYSATHYVKGLNVQQRHRDLPAAGIFLRYEFTAFRVKWMVSYKSITHFLTNVCAILGGIYAFAGMVDNFVFRLQKSLASGAGKKGGVGMPQM